MLCLFFTLFDVGIDPNSIAMTITYTLLMSDIFYEFIWDLALIEQKFVSVERIRQYLDHPRENLTMREANNNVQKSIQNSNNLPKNSKLHNIELSYPNGNKNEQNNIAIEFEEINFCYDIVDPQGGGGK